MKITNLIIFYLLLILFSNCKNKNEHTIEGLWYYCGYKGEYEELLIKDSVVIHLMITKNDFQDRFTDDFNFYSMIVGPFRYHDDSLRIDKGNEFYNEKSTKLIKQHVNFITPEQIEINPVLDERMDKLILNSDKLNIL